MNQAKINETMIALMRCFLAGERFGGELTEELRDGVFALANRHDIAHLVGEALETQDASFVQAKRKAIYRYLRQDDERQRIYGLFETESIPFIPLKGSVICALYHDRWQRSGCDIDILVRQCDLERAQAALERECGFRFRMKSAQDVSLLSPYGVHLELHYAFDEKEVSVEDVWRSSAPVREESMHRTMGGEMFLLHHIAHMAKHFRSGGCGFRPFVDLWFIKNKMNYDEVALNNLLQERGLKSFADAVFGLLALWFAQGESTPLLDAAAEYILPAGVYGSMKNRVAIGQLNKGGKASYFVSRLFQTREALEYPYPALKKHGWLLPFCQVHRWYKLLADGKLRRITGELRTNGAMDIGYRDDVGALLKALQL